jgi:hypothetical protein
LEDLAVKFQRIVRRHKRENELNRRRNRRGERVLMRLRPGFNELAGKDYIAVAEYLLAHDNVLVKQALRERRFCVGGIIVKARR